MKEKKSDLFDFPKVVISEDSTLFNIIFEKPKIIILRPLPYSGKTMYYQSIGRTQRNETTSIVFEMDSECIIQKYLDYIK